MVLCLSLSRTLPMAISCNEVLASMLTGTFHRTSLVKSCRIPRRLPLLSPPGAVGHVPLKPCVTQFKQSENLILSQQKRQSQNLSENSNRRIRDTFPLGMSYDEVYYVGYDALGVPKLQGESEMHSLRE